MFIFRFFTFLFCFVFFNSIYFNNCNGKEIDSLTGGYIVVDGDNNKAIKKQKKEYQKQIHKKNEKLVKENNRKRESDRRKYDKNVSKKQHNKSINIKNISKAQKNNACKGEVCKINDNAVITKKQKRNVNKIKKMEFLDDKTIIDLIDEQEAMVITPKEIKVRLKNKGVPKICLPNTIMAKSEIKKINKELEKKKDNLKKYLKQELEEKNISDEIIDYIMTKMTFKKKTKEKHQEFVKRTMIDFITRYKVEDRVRNGRLYKKMYQDDFNDIEEIFFVEPNAILTIWSMETNYGSFIGNYNAFQALYSACMNAETMARLDYFYKNIVALAFLVDKGYFKKDVISSFDGGLGGCQFMPDSVYRLAVSLKGGKVDIINNNSDVFASIANYLHSMGWRYGEGILTEIELPKIGEGGINPCDIGMNKSKTISGWKKLGIVPNKNGIGKEHMEDGSMVASLIITDVDDYLLENNGDNSDIAKAKRRAFLVYNNYKVILGYNQHPAYGLTAGLLYEAIGF